MMASKQNTKLSWLRLIRSEQVGPVTFWQLISKYGSAENALDALANLIKKGNNRYKLCSEEDALKEMEAHTKNAFHLIAAFEPNFPAILRPLPDCPPILSVYGQCDILNKQTVGIVGARNASLNGLKLSQKLASDLAKAGWVVASGLARGIDHYAHQGSLNKGTIAVVAGGVDVIYPPEHTAIYHEIAKTGAVISEMPLSLFPGATHFPRRNRLISGLSRGIVVIEAALKSGSLITAQYALDQGRELFAVPGSPLDPRCKGTNELLRQGAGLIESAQDVLNFLEQPTIHKLSDQKTIQKILDSSLPKDSVGLSEATESSYHTEITVDWENLERSIFQDLSPTPISLDEILQRYSAPPQTIITLIFEWELEGRIERHPGNMISRAA